jgi:hypothetical protein
MAHGEEAAVGFMGALGCSHGWVHGYGGWRFLALGVAVAIAGCP